MSLEAPLLNIKAHPPDKTSEKGNDAGVDETKLVVVETMVECMVVDANEGVRFDYLSHFLSSKICHDSTNQCYGLEL